MKLKFITLLIYCLIGFSAFAIQVKIENARLEHNKEVNGNKVLSVHCKLTVTGAKNEDMYYMAFVEDDKGNAHLNKSGTAVCASHAIKPGYDPCYYDDVQVYLYNSNIEPKPGKNTYRVYIYVLYNGLYYGKTYAGDFSMTGTTSSSNSNSNSKNNNSSSSGSKNSNASGFPINRTYYATWSAGFTDASFGVAGYNGYPMLSPTFYITENRVTISGWSKQDDNRVYEFVNTNSDGSRLYRSISRISPSLIYQWDLLLGPDKRYLSITTSIGAPNNPLKSTIRNFVADKALRDKIIAENRGRVRMPDQALFNSLMESPYKDWKSTSNSNSSSSSNSTVNTCSVCGGNRVDKTPYYINDPSGAGTHARGITGYTHKSGKCKYCGKYDWHIHVKCHKCQ